MTHIGHSGKVLVMRVFIAVLVLIFSLQSWTKADDVSELEIEGMSLGDSLLSFMTIDQIEKELNNKDITAFYKNNTFATLSAFFLRDDFEIYDDVGIIIKPNDSNFKIYALEGTLYFDNMDISECHKKQELISKDLKNFLKYSKQSVWHDENPPNYLASVKYIDFLKSSLKTGQLRTICYDYKDKNKTDLLYVVINSKEFIKFLEDNY